MCWGENGWGQLGIGNEENSNRPVQVSSLSEVEQVAMGSQNTCVLIADGSVKCWGYNYDGRVGDGTMSYRNLPVKVVSLNVLGENIN